VEQGLGLSSPSVSAIGCQPGRSFSSFLLLFYRDPEEIAMDLHRDAWEGEVEFSPAHRW
jgi:hypothetical protein